MGKLGVTSNFRDLASYRQRERGEGGVQEIRWRGEREREVHGKNWNNKKRVNSMTKHRLSTCMA